jgi:hypothetical protein
VGLRSTVGRLTLLPLGRANNPATALQVTGVLLMCGGVVVVYLGGAKNPAFAHGIIGIVVVLLTLFQPVNGFVRPHHGARLRRAWELLHKGTGRGIVLLALVNMGLGVLLVVPPHGVWIAYFVYLGVLVGVVVPALEVATRGSRAEAAARLQAKLAADAPAAKAARSGDEGAADSGGGGAAAGI